MDLINILVGGGILAFIEFLIQRHDRKAGKHDEVLNAIGKLDKKIVSVEDKIDKLENKIDQVEADGKERDGESATIAARIRILQVADELLENRRHSKDRWDQCLSDITMYEDYCQTHPKFKNGQTAATVEFIKRTYAVRLEKHDFNVMEVRQ